MTEDSIPLMAHLEALRRGLIIASGTWLVAFVSLYGFSDKLFLRIAEPLKEALPEGSSLVFLTATEPFFTYLRLAAVAALVGTLPVILWQVWSFITSGLRVERNGLGALFIVGSCLAFLNGAYLGFSYVFPLIVRVLVHFGTDAGSVNAMLSMGDYLSLAMTMMLAFGLVFELPVLMMILSRLGIANSQWFATRRKYMLIVAFVFGAIITPGPDVLSQCSIAVPFVVLYELGILGARLSREASPVKSAAKDSVGG